MCEDFSWCSFCQGIITGLISSLIAFLATLFVFSRSCLKISPKIARGVNKSFYKPDGEVAWKFKIVNKSPFVRLSNIDTKLVGIQYVRNSDNTFTEHRTSIPCIPGVRILERYTPDWIVRLKRKRNPKYTADYTYRPLTFMNLDDAKFEVIELSIVYTDSISGWTHFASKKFESTIVEGEFSNDSKLDCIISQDIPKVAWDNHKNRMEKEKQSEKAD